MESAQGSPTVEAFRLRIKEMANFVMTQEARSGKRGEARRANWKEDFERTMQRLESMPLSFSRRHGTESIPRYMTAAQRTEHRVCSEYVKLLNDRQDAVNREKALSDIKVALTVRL